jgi:hypothetical protein
VHGVKGQRKRAVVEELAGVDLAGRVAEVVRRGHGQRRMDGLGVHDGWSCNVIRLHCRRAHGLKVNAAGVVSRVRLQTLFRKKPRYFMVAVPEVDLRRPPERRPDVAAAVSRAGGCGVRVARAAARPGASARAGASRHGPRSQARLRGHAVAVADTIPGPGRAGGRAFTAAAGVFGAGGSRFQHQVRPRGRLQRR